jgi:glycosyltransferase involved in cell wall biosynthesis
LRIALLTYSTRPRGGVVHTLALAEALAAVGQDVTVWTLGRGGDARFFREVDPRVRLEVVPFVDEEGEGMGPRIVRSISELRAAFSGHRYDIVHAQDCISANAVLDQGHLLRTVHHIDHFTTPELAACHERAITTPSAHVCVSAAVAAELADGWGITATVIPNGVDAARFAAAAERSTAVAAGGRPTAAPGGGVAAVTGAGVAAASGGGTTAGAAGALTTYVHRVGGEAGRDRHESVVFGDQTPKTALSSRSRQVIVWAREDPVNVPGHRTSAAVAARARWRDRLGRYVLTVGGIEPRKGSIALLEAYALLRRTHPGVALIVAGGETLFDYRPYRARWEARAVELGVEPVVLGPVPDPDLPGLVAAAAAFAFPSVKEGFGLAAMEALAAGVPTVVSDLPVLRQVFDGAVTFADGPEELAKALAEALDAPDPQRANVGRALAARHTWAESAQRHLDLYRSLIGHSSV